MKLTQRAIELIEKIIAKGFRVEVIPTKDGVKVIEVRRTEAK